MISWLQQLYINHLIGLIIIINWLEPSESYYHHSFYFTKSTYIIHFPIKQTFHVIQPEFLSSIYYVYPTLPLIFNIQHFPIQHTYALVNHPFLYYRNFSLTFSNTHFPPLTFPFFPFVLIYFSLWAILCTCRYKNSDT